MRGALRVLAWRFFFDCRIFGRSGGLARHVVDPFRHLEDWRAAISHVRSLAAVDGSRLALWGTFFSGGHVVACVAEDHDIAAVIAQVPFVSAVASLRIKKIGDLLTSSVLGIYDLIRAGLLLKPHYSPVVARPGRFAAMNTPDSYPGYMSLVGEKSEWENKMASRSFIKISLYSPVAKAGKVSAPALIIAGRHDSLIPLDAVLKLAGKIPRSELVVEDCNHFEPYTGDLFERFVEKQGAFLKAHLLPRTL